MKIAIIDDLYLSKNKIRESLNHYLAEHYAGETPVVGEFEIGESFLSHFAPEAYDIIFIDQYMDGLSGIDTAKQIQIKDDIVALIFITNSFGHAIDSFSVRVCGYLVKPFLYEQFEKTIELAHLSKIRNVRFIRMEQSKILLHKILWCN